jgi:drug/metabolite transporter (DMT)-like permease
VSAVFLALAAGFFFGASAVAIRSGFLRRPLADPDLASICLVLSGLAIPSLLVVATGKSADLGELWPFFVLGAISPAASALLWVRAVQHAGAARASLFLGTTPLWAVLIAIAALGEPFELPLSVGCILIVLGTVVVYREQIRPDDFLWIGIPLALGAAILFALRDNGARLASEQTTAPSLAAATATLLGGAVCLAVFVLATRRLAGAPVARLSQTSIPLDFVVAGLCHGGATALLYEALARGRITVVEPLTSTSALWGVTLAAVVLGRHEAIGLRLLVAATCVVIGGALIGVYR